MRVRSKTRRLLEVVPASKLPMSHGQRETLIALHIFESKEVNDPSYAQLAVFCNVTCRTVQRAIKALEEKDFVLVIGRVSASGYRLSNTYKLTETGNRIIQELRSRGSLVEVPTIDRAIVVTEDRSLYEPMFLTKGVTKCHIPNKTVMSVSEPLQLTNKLSHEEKEVAIGILSGLPTDAAQQLADELRERLVRGEVKSPLGYLASLVRAYQEGRFTPILAGQGAKARQSGT